MRYRWLPIPVLIFLLTACLFAQEDKTIGVEYDGVGLRQHDARTTQVNGTLKFKNHQGGEIVVEARSAVPCAYGHCPVIGEPPLASERYSAPGSFSLLLPAPAKSVMIVATYSPGAGGVRIAHRLLNQEESVIDGVELSLDRPYPPLR